MPLVLRNYFLFISLLGFTAVALGAFGAHALQERLAITGYQKTWETAVFYHVSHTLAALFTALAAETGKLSFPAARHILRCWLIGCLLFSGSLYILALGGPRIFGPITPLGGLFFMLGWGGLGWTVFKAPRRETPPS
jgi:uncharacterized membrane protein YgdD (TMEM256/DUF423 family)